MHYKTRRSQWMQKHKFGVTCPGEFLLNLYLSHPSLKNSAIGPEFGLCVGVAVLLVLMSISPKHEK
jgi:hypothetical protein